MTKITHQKSSVYSYPDIGTVTIRCKDNNDIIFVQAKRYLTLVFGEHLFYVTSSQTKDRFQVTHANTGMSVFKNDFYSSGYCVEKFKKFVEDSKNEKALLKAIENCNNLGFNRSINLSIWKSILNIF